MYIYIYIYTLTLNYLLQYEEPLDRVSYVYVTYVYMYAIVA